MPAIPASLAGSPYFAFASLINSFAPIDTERAEYIESPQNPETVLRLIEDIEE